MVIKTLLSSTDPIIEQEDGYSLDEENERFSGNLLDKTCSKHLFRGATALKNKV